MVYGHYYDNHDKLIDTGFTDRLVGISLEELLAIPIPIGAAGGRHKRRAVVGALQGALVNAIVTDLASARVALGRPIRPLTRAAGLCVSSDTCETVPLAG